MIKIYGPIIFFSTVACLCYGLTRYFNSTAPDKSQFKLPNIVVHIDLKRTPLKLSYLNYILPILKECGVNGLLMEYEDMFPYEGEIKILRSPYNYGKQELQNFVLKANELKINIIPLVQTFGHLEYVLKLDKFKHLRESPERVDSICPKANESQYLIKEMLTQVIQFHTEVQILKYIHIGFDEVYSMRKCKLCKNVKLSKKSILFSHLNTVKSLVRSLSSKTKVLLWDDMFRDWTSESTFDKAQVVCWEYTGVHKFSQFPRRLLNKYHKMFDNIWIASAFKGADGDTSTLPNIRKRYQNHANWLNLILHYEFEGGKRYNFEGIILTGWSRYSHFRHPCDLLPASLPSLILNLLLIKHFRTKPASMNSTGEYFTDISSDFATALGCQSAFDFVNQSIYFNFTSCNFNGVQLYTTLKNYLMFYKNPPIQIKDLLISMCVGNLSPDDFKKKVNGLTLEYTINQTNLKRDMLGQINKYYDEPFAIEYVDLKMAAANQSLESILKRIDNVTGIRCKNNIKRSIKEFTLNNGSVGDGSINLSTIRYDQVRR